MRMSVRLLYGNFAHVLVESTGLFYGERCTCFEWSEQLLAKETKGMDDLL